MDLPTPRHAAPWLANTPRPPSTEVVDVHFEVHGQALPSDHGFAVFGAVCRALPHAGDIPGLGIHRISGHVALDCLRLTPESRLTVRASLASLGDLWCLVGQWLNVQRFVLVVGEPSLRKLRPAATLRAPFVTLGRPGKTPDEFRQALEQALVRTLGSEVEANRIAVRLGVSRESIRIKGDVADGYAVELSGLRAETSLRIQQRGVGGRRHFGAGLFLPAPTNLAWEDFHGD